MSLFGLLFTLQPNKNRSFRAASERMELQDITFVPISYSPVLFNLKERFLDIFHFLTCGKEI